MQRLFWLPYQEEEQISQKCSGFDKASRYALLICDHIGATTLRTLNFPSHSEHLRSEQLCRHQGSMNHRPVECHILRMMRSQPFRMRHIRKLPLLISSFVFIDVRVRSRFDQMILIYQP